MKNITTKYGLLFEDDRQIGLPEADHVARQCGFIYAEQLVKALETKSFSELRKEFEESINV